MPSSKPRPQPSLLKYTLHKTTISKPPPLSSPTNKRPKPKKAKPSLSPSAFIVKKSAKRKPSKLSQFVTAEGVERCVNEEERQDEEMGWREDMMREEERAMELLEEVRRRRHENSLQGEILRGEERMMMLKDELKRRLEREFLLQLYSSWRDGDIVVAEDL